MVWSVLSKRLVFFGFIAWIFIGALIGALVGAGTPSRLIDRYQKFLHSGGILLSVHGYTTDQLLQASEIFRQIGGKEVFIMNENKVWDQLKVV